MECIWEENAWRDVVDYTEKQVRTRPPVERTFGVPQQTLSSSVPQDWELIEKRREYSVLMLAYITAMHDNQGFAIPSVSELQKLSDEDLDTLERRIKDARVNSKIRKRNECTVCMDGQSCVVLVPCGQQGFCVACANDIHVCPLFRAPVTGHIKIANTGLWPVFLRVYWSSIYGW